MIHGSRASGAARPLSWSPPGPCRVCRSELAIHAPVNAAGPAMPAAAPSRNTARRQPLTTTPFCDGSGTSSAHGTTPNQRLAVTGRLAQPDALEAQAGPPGPAGQPDAVARQGVRGVHDEDSGRSPGNEIARSDLTRGKGGEHSHWHQAQRLPQASARGSLRDTSQVAY